MLIQIKTGALDNSKSQHDPHRPWLGAPDHRSAPWLGPTVLPPEPGIFSWESHGVKGGV